MHDVVIPGNIVNIILLMLSYYCLSTALFITLYNSIYSKHKTLMACEAFGDNFLLYPEHVQEYAYNSILTTMRKTAYIPLHRVHRILAYALMIKKIQERGRDSEE